MVPKQAPQAPLITDTPPTPIDPQDTPFAGRLRSRSQQWLGSLIHETRSRSSSGSSRHSRSPDHVKDVIVNLGVAAGRVAAGPVGAEHIKPKNPDEEDVLDGVRAFLSAFLRQAGTAVGDSVETIEVRNDAQSVHNFNPITEVDENPFRTSTETTEGISAEGDLSIEQQKRTLSRESTFGEFVRDIFMYENESGQKVPARARLDTGMTCNAIRYSQALMVRYSIKEYTGEPCIIGDGTSFSPMGQVTIPFHFVNSGNAKTWHVEFLVFPEGSPFDVCLGRRFISLAGLLKSNHEALPVEFRKLNASEERENRYRTHQASRDSEYTRDKEDKRYDNRRNTKPKDKEPKKWDSAADNRITEPSEDLMGPTDEGPDLSKDKKS